MTSPIAPDLVAPRAMPARARSGVLRRLLKRPLAVAGLAVIVLTVAGAVLAPWLTAFDPNEQLFDGLTLEGAPLPPDGRFWLGTDLLGRLLHHLRVVGENLVQLSGLPAERLVDEARMLAEHPVGLGRPLPERVVDGREPDPVHTVTVSIGWISTNCVGRG